MKKLIIGAIAAVGISLAAAPTASAEPFSVCPSGQTGVATADTSCAFADNVRLAWYGQPGTIVLAYSPVTGLAYSMQCTSVFTDYWLEAKRCVGLNASGVALVVYVN